MPYVTVDMPLPTPVSTHSDTRLRDRLTGGLPMANLSSVSRTAAGRIRPATLISRLVHAPGVLPDTSLAPLVLLLDAEPYQVDLLEAVAALPREVYLLDLPPRQQLAKLRSVPALAGVLRAAVRSKLPRGPYVLAGSGAAGVVMHEVAVQLQSAGEQVRFDCPARARACPNC
jgi:hypothetical protein